MSTERSAERAAGRAPSLASRRAFLRGCAAAAPLLVLGPSLLSAQPSSTVNMEGDFYIPVRPEPKPDATPLLDEDAMIALERTLACPCPCSLDIYTCRTTDVTCSNSPAIHRDVQRMIDGGYSGDEIVAQLSDVYGQRIMLVPSKRGFNLVGWFLPFAAIGTGAVVIAGLLRSWRRNAIQSAVTAGSRTVGSIGVQATADEMARLQAALRDDSHS